MTSLYLNTLTTFLYALFIPIFGYLSDRYGRSTIMLTACVLMLVIIYPAFIIIVKGTVIEQFISQSIISILIAMFAGPLTATAAELFPLTVRYSGIGLSLNLAASIFGGTTPLVCAWLTKTTANPLTPAYYFILSAVIAGIAVLAMHRKTSDVLELQTN
jgi:MHS family proline/betaine transporter-like MFS transporter